MVCRVLNKPAYDFRPAGTAFNSEAKIRLNVLRLDNSG